MDGIDTIAVIIVATIVHAANDFVAVIDIDAVIDIVVAIIANTVIVLTIVVFSAIGIGIATYRNLPFGSSS